MGRPCCWGRVAGSLEKIRGVVGVHSTLYTLYVMELALMVVVPVAFALVWTGILGIWLMTGDWKHKW